MIACDRRLLLIGNRSNPTRLPTLCSNSGGLIPRISMFRLIRVSILTCACSATLIAQTPANSKAAPMPQASQSVDTGSEFAAARRLEQQGKYDEAIAQLQTLAAKTPKPAGVTRELGTAYYSKGEYLKAAEYLKQATDTDPNDKEAVQLLGLSYYLAGRPAEAIPYLEKVQTWYPRANIDAAYILGISYIQAKDYPNARKAFAKCSTCLPIRAPAICLRRACCFARSSLRSPKSTRRKRSLLDPKLAARA